METCAHYGVFVVVIVGRVGFVFWWINWFVCFIGGGHNGFFCLVFLVGVQSVLD
jgi:hypothetical protein